VIEQLEIQAKYAGYIDRQHDEIAKHQRNEETQLPADFLYDQVVGLTAEVREKLVRIKPQTVGQAARIPGMTPAAISIILVHLKKRKLLSERQLVS
jgi:tRNA uridine 5-carboxymethylaminomethyl modification enzyme